MAGPFFSLNSRYASEISAALLASAFSRAISSALVRTTSAIVARAYPNIITHVIRTERSFHEKGCCG
eukprot:scaffold122041_cov63-Phaeocystis_antarctica.AAC.2